jgi:uncharacterized lipoprotein YddW (UPF0748 family)
VAKELMQMFFSYKGRGKQLLITLVLALTASAQEVSLAQQKAATRSDEVRALWVVRTTLTSPEKIKQMVESAKAAGFNTLIVQVRGRGDTYYRGRFEPRAVELKEQPVTFDPLATTLT